VLLVTDTSALVADCTAVDVVAVLLAVFESVVVLVTVAVFTMLVPGVAPAGT
jgi:hypothetical protein